MANLQDFGFDYEGQEVRFFGEGDVVEMVAQDVITILYPDARRESYSKYLEKVPSKWKGKKSILTPGGMQEMTTLYEPGFYKLLSRSDSPRAELFQEWLYEIVLPSIRKTGSYSVLQSTSANPALLPVRVRKEKLELIQTGIDIISQLGGLDERDVAHFKSLTRSIVLDDVLQASALPSGEERLEWPISDRAVVLGFNPTRGQLMKIGKVAAALYRARYGSDPIKREQFVDGATRKVNMYAHKDLAILDQAIRSIMEQENN